jgi:hypothetical protein
VAEVDAGIEQVFGSDVHGSDLCIFETQVGQWAALRSR